MNFQQLTHLSRNKIVQIYVVIAGVTVGIILIMFSLFVTQYQLADKEIQYREALQERDQVIDVLKARIEQLEGENKTLNQENAAQKAVGDSGGVPKTPPSPPKKATAPATVPTAGVLKATYYDYGLKGNPNYSRENSTCASRDYSRGTMLKVTNPETGASVVCRVNDYGPQAWTGKHIDLSSYAFKQLAPLSKGVIVVKIEVAQ